MTSSLRCTSNRTARSNSYGVTVIPSVTPGVSINTTPIVTICQGTPLSFYSTSVGTGTAPAYQWFKNGFPVSGATATSYTDAGLLDKDTLSISLTTNAVCATANNVLSNKVGVRVTDTVIPTISITASTTHIRLGDEVTFTATYTGGGTTPAIQWLRNGVALPGETNNTFISTAITGGDYISATMYSYYSCATPRLVTSNDIAMDPPLGIKNTQGWLGNMSLYPNPTSGQLTLSMSIAAAQVGSTLRIEVMSTVGQVVYVQQMTADKTKFSSALTLPASLANGSYMLRIFADGARASAAFVLSR
jgi:hypothetical protein